MPRRKCCRRVKLEPSCTLFKPAGIPTVILDQIALTVDEFEALRLADHQGLYHEQAAAKMNISRQTFGRIVSEARSKVATALIEEKALKIGGGVFELDADRCRKQQGKRRHQGLGHRTRVHGRDKPNNGKTTHQNDVLEKPAPGKDKLNDKEL